MSGAVVPALAVPRAISHDLPPNFPAVRGGGGGGGFLGGHPRGTSPDLSPGMSVRVCPAGPILLSLSKTTPASDHRRLQSTWRHLVFFLSCWSNASVRASAIHLTAPRLLSVVLDADPTLWSGLYLIYWTVASSRRLCWHDRLWLEITIALSQWSSRSRVRSGRMIDVESTAKVLLKWRVIWVMHWYAVVAVVYAFLPPPPPPPSLFLPFSLEAV